VGVCAGLLVGVCVVFVRFLHVEVLLFGEDLFGLFMLRYGGVFFVLRHIIRLLRTRLL
jgi:hypothetical protein